MTLILDAGALVALERRDRFVLRRIKIEEDAARLVWTHGGVVGQVWRGGFGRQAPLARALRSVQVANLSDRLGRESGLLLARSRTVDVIDAALVVLAGDGDQIVTSDPVDIGYLVAAAGKSVEIIPV